MESLEKTTEEGFHFIELFLLPITWEDYFLHKNQIDLFIRELKEEHQEVLDQWKFEIKHLLPRTGRISDASNSFMQKVLTELLKIKEGEQDLILSIFSENTVICGLDFLPKNLNNYLLLTLSTPERREILKKLCNSSLGDDSKMLLAIMMAPYIFLLPYIEFFLKENLKSPTMDTCNRLIDYAISLGDSQDTYKKLSVICNVVFGSDAEFNFSDIDAFIQEFLDKDGTYDEILAMKKINEYFSKVEAKPRKKKLGENFNERL